MKVSKAIVNEFMRVNSVQLYDCFFERTVSIARETNAKRKLRGRVFIELECNSDFKENFGLTMEMLAEYLRKTLCKRLLRNVMLMDVTDKKIYFEYSFNPSKKVPDIQYNASGLTEYEELWENWADEMIKSVLQEGFED